MSKSRGNVVNPDDIVNEFGADTLRTYEMFIGDFEKAAPWSENGVKGCKRFLDRVWVLNDMVTDGDAYSPELEKAFHKTIKKVSEDMDQLKMNTAIAALMSLLNDIYAKGSLNRAELRTYLILLNPIAPHITEEMWQKNGFEGLLAQATWCEYDEQKIKDTVLNIPVQICGKLRSVITVDATADKQTILDAAKADAKVAAAIAGKEIVKEIFIPGKMVNLVVK